MSSVERLSELHIQNFRCFKEFHATSLGDVNLLIGKNNGGKTTMLEAIEFSYQPYRQFFISCCRRKEIVVHKNNNNLDYKCLFYGRNLYETKISIGNASLMILKDRLYFQDLYYHAPRESADVNLDRHFEMKNIYDIWIQNIKKDNMLPILVETDFFKSDWLYILWNTIVGNEYEDYVVEMMKIIEPNIERIVFTSGEGQPIPFFKIKGMKERVHLGYLGEGARRLFVLAMFCARSVNSVLLIDEIDLGFHYSIMFQLWNTLLEWSKKFNIQIFATTHSQDCIGALYQIIKKETQSSCDVKILRINKDHKEPVVYEKEDIFDAVGAGVEIR